jgi:uncharacterized protein (DUF697 family)
MALPVSLRALRGLTRELQASEARPLVVGGARELAPVLAKELGRGAAAGAVRSGEDPEGAAVYVHVLAGGDQGEDALKRARRARVPIVAVSSTDEDVPFVLATDVVRVGAGEGFPLSAIARVIARRLGEEAAPLAARVPLLRRAVCEQLVASFARRNAVVAAAVFVPGADLPVLTLNQLRMLLRIEQAYGLDAGLRERAPELLAALGAGLGLRAVARELLDLVPVGGWVVKGAVAYAGTRALGEAAIRRLEGGVPSSQRGSKRRLGGASRGAP